jgi:CBS domain-containing protein
MPNIITAVPDESVYDAAVKIVEHQIDALPVVEPVETEKGNHIKYKIIGKISKTNITKFFVELGKPDV